MAQARLGGYPEVVGALLFNRACARLLLPESLVQQHFETGLKLVKKRGELMSQANGGAMAAIIGLSAETIKTLLLQNGLTNIAIANNNSHTQIVISGQKADIDRKPKIL